jgi:carboxyl-terminal processing protease
MTDHSLPAGTPAGDDPSTPEPAPEQAAEPAAEPRRQSRAPIYIAALLVVLLGGSGMFVSGFLLGRQSELTPGTGESRQSLFQPFWDAYNDISQNYVGARDEHLLVEGAIKGLFEALGDPFSSYMTEEEYQASLTNISGQFEGIGAEMNTQDATGTFCEPISATCKLTVLKVIRNSPALRAGLLAGDVVVKVDGNSTVGLTRDAAIDTIRGPKGTTVVLGLERAGQPVQLSITRDVIVKEDVSSQVLADGRVGYLKINSFSAGAADDLAAQLRELVTTDGVKALILDLRDDPGGYVNAAHQIASQFVATAPLYWEQSAGHDPIAQQPDPGGVATDPTVKMVVLVNGGTASAAEIVAASLQGNHRAQLVGQTTYGKGTIQEWKPLAGAGGYRLSVRKWLTPDQTWIHGKGLTPDVVVEVPADQPAGTDIVLDRAIQLLISGSGTGTGVLEVMALAA